MQSGYLKHEGIVLSPLTGSLAERSGIVNGDIVTKIDGKDISDIETLRAKI
jgi:S1-C subfamily serine protease